MQLVCVDGYRYLYIMVCAIPGSRYLKGSDGNGLDESKSCFQGVSNR